MRNLAVIFFLFFLSHSALYSINEKSQEFLEQEPIVSVESIVSRSGIVIYLYKNYLPILAEDSLYDKTISGEIEYIYSNRKVSDSVVYKTITKLIMSLQARGKHSDIIRLINTVLPYYKQNSIKDNPQIEYSYAHLQLMLGAAYEEVGFWQQAMSMYKEAMLIVDKSNNLDMKAFLLNNMANVYLKRNDLTKAAALYNQAIEINTKLGSKKELFNNYNNLACLYMEHKQYEQALDYAIKALSCVDRTSEQYLYYVEWLNMANIYLAQNKLDVAWEYLHEGLNFMKENGYELDYGANCLLAAKAWQKKNDSKKEKYWLDEGINTAVKINNNDLKILLYNAVSSYYKNRDDYENAYKYLILSKSIQDSINQYDNWRRLSDMEMVYEVEKAAQENNIISSSLKIKSLILQKQRIVLIFIVIACFIAIFSIAYRYNIQKKNKQIKEEFAAKQAELHRKEKEMLIKRQAELQNELEIKSRELTSKVLCLVRNNEFVINITEELKQLLLELNPKDSAKKEHVRELLLKLRVQTNDSFDSEFRYYFEQVYQSFYDKLSATYPNLTIKDMRLCAFLRLGLSTKEIAAITFKEVRSIDSARNRLRKKMDVLPEEDLVEILTKLGTIGDTQMES